MRQAFGWRGALRRVSYDIRLRSGWLRHRLASRPDYSSASAVTWSHRFDLGEIRTRVKGLRSESCARPAVREAQSVLDGRLRFYGGDVRDVGWPPRWLADAPGARDVHWSKVDDDAAGDIKDIWEPSRLGFTFVLARAFAVTGDELYAGEWWRALESWAAANPPNTGPNW